MLCVTTDCKGSSLLHYLEPLTWSLSASGRVTISSQCQEVTSRIWIPGKAILHDQTRICDELGRRVDFLIHAALINRSNRHVMKLKKIIHKMLTTVWLIVFTLISLVAMEVFINNNRQTFPEIWSWFEFIMDSQFGKWLGKWLCKSQNGAPLSYYCIFGGFTLITLKETHNQVTLWIFVCVLKLETLKFLKH